ncbi:hypothetical protein ACGF0J_21445 [Nonomuraea sp. NPDC047897]|uniref:hypothetical protein n=1 Tax=Nonomuraea sp. NPDC047897 TaxID=3364346 RepID=UPI00372220C8
MQDPTEPDRQEILTGPGDESRAPRTRKRASKKTVAIAAAALAGVLVAGGIGFSMAGTDPVQPAGPSQQSQGPGTAEGPGEDLGDDGDATMGDAVTEEPGDGTPAEAGQDDTASDGDTSGDAPRGDTSGGVPDGGTGSRTGAAGTDSKGAAESKNTNVSRPSTPPAQDSGDDTGTDGTADGAADGPAGEVAGQCAKSGC